MSTTIVQSKYKRVDESGNIFVHHWVTSADIVLDGTSKRVPLITEMTGLLNIKTEVETARGGEVSLDARLDEVDVKLQPESLLSSLKTVDGTGTGLISDMVDDCHVNDLNTDTSSLWTSNKINTELGKKVNSTDVATVAGANKILKLNASGLLPASVTGSAASAAKWTTARLFELTGDVSGSVEIDGSENVSVSVSVNNNSHDHKEITYAGPTIINNTGTGNITNFEANGVVKSSIDANGKFTGDAATVAGKEVNDSLTTTTALWTAAKILESIGGSAISSATKKIVLGGYTIQWGTLDMSSTTSAVPLSFTGFTTSLDVFHSCESADTAWTVNKQPGGTLSQVSFKANKSAASSKITWIAIGK